MLGKRDNGEGFKDPKSPVTGFRSQKAHRNVARGNLVDKE